MHQIDKLNLIANKLQNASRKDDGGIQASCPCSVHSKGDRSRGLHVDPGSSPEGIVVWCGAGCSSESIMAELGLEMSFLMPDREYATAKPELESPHTFDSTAFPPPSDQFPHNPEQQRAEQLARREPPYEMWKVSDPVTGEKLKNPFKVKFAGGEVIYPPHFDLTTVAQQLPPLEALGELGDNVAIDPYFARDMPPTKWVAPSFIPASNLTVLVGPPGSGKTSVLVHSLFQASNLHQIAYFHTDAGDGDVRAFGPLVLKDANSMFNYMPLGYGNKAPYSAADLTRNLLELPHVWKHRQERELEGCVMVIDTLSTIVDVNKDDQLRNMLLAMNEIKKRTGLAFVLVAHTNKHKVEDRHVFRGSGELLNHCDNLIYLDYDQERCTEREQYLVTRTDPIFGGKARTPGIDRTFAINRQTREVVDIDLLNPEERRGAEKVKELLRDSEQGYQTRAAVISWLKQEADMGRNRADELIAKGVELGAWRVEKAPHNKILVVAPGF